MIDSAQLKRLMAQLDISHDAYELLPLAQAIWREATIAEREECATVCDVDGPLNDGITCAELIRARKSEGE